jgi:hypothetical protein
VTHDLNIDELGDEQANQACPKEIPKDSERHTNLFERTISVHFRSADVEEKGK